MLGFVVGTLCLIGLVKVLRRRGWAHAAMCGHGYGGFGGPWEGRGWGGVGPGGRRGFGARFGRGMFLRSLHARLQPTPEQEEAIGAALGEVRATARRVRRELDAARPELASAIRGEQFDETVFGELSHKADEAAQTMRRAVVDAIAKVHVTLDERQRGVLADLVARGGLGGLRGGGLGGFGGPYRGGASL